MCGFICLKYICCYEVPKQNNHHNYDLYDATGVQVIIKGLSPVTRNLCCQSARGNRSGAVRYFPEAVRPRGNTAAPDRFITMTSWWAWWHLKSPASPWRRHQMETFSALLAICAGNSPVPDEFPAQRPVTRSFDVFFDLRPNKLLRKKSWGWWFETPSHPLYRHRNVACLLYHLSRRKSKRTSKLLVTGFGHRWIPRTKGQ